MESKLTGARTDINLSTMSEEESKEAPTTMRKRAPTINIGSSPSHRHRNPKPVSGKIGTLNSLHEEESPSTTDRKFTTTTTEFHPIDIAESFRI